MTVSSSGRIRIVAAIMLSVVTLGAVSETAQAASLPFSDSRAAGQLAFCDKDGHPITTGKIGDAPFAWTSVSSSPAPSKFGAGVGKGVLYVFQPREGVDPGEWTGKQLTASSTYTNGDHPMAQGTSVDPALVDFVSVFPAKWQGLMQLRMYFFAPNRPGYSKTYPAAVIRVTGDRWSVVDGGSVACDVGKAVSDESVDLPASRVNPLNPRSTPGKSVSASVSAGAKPSSPSSSASAGHVGRPADSSAPTASDGGLVSNAAQSKAVKTSAAGPIWAGAGVLSLLAVAVAVALGVRRRRRKPGAMDM